MTVTNGASNQITITAGQSRSYVVGGNRGVWGGANDPWIAAHEAGHLMLLSDRYMDRGGKSLAFPGSEGSMMGSYGGKATDAERKMVAENCGYGK